MTTLTRSLMPLLFALAALPALAQSEAPKAEKMRTPVLIELFTSEGCSSCPPADAAVMQLVHEQPLEGIELIALEEHVDYWDNLGWRDPFSGAVFTSRQEAFLNAVGRGGMYTPQAVIDGKSDAVGSDRRGILDAARASAADQHGKASVQIVQRDANKIDLRAEVNGLAKPGAELWIALVEDAITTQVSRGENAGRTLPHAAVVRSMMRVAQAGSGATSVAGTASIALDPSWKSAHLRAVAFAQDPSSRRILASTSL